MAEMNRDEFERYLTLLQDLRIYTLEDHAEVLDEIDEKYGYFYVEVKSGLNVEKHRWYEITTSVHKLGDWFIGVRGVTQHYSETQDFDDVGVYLEFFEMELVWSPTYAKKVK